MKPLFATLLFGAAALSGTAQASLPENPLPVAVYSLPGSDFSTIGNGGVSALLQVSTSQYAEAAFAPIRN